MDEYGDGRLSGGIQCVELGGIETGLATNNWDDEGRIGRYLVNSLLNSRSLPHQKHHPVLLAVQMRRRRVESEWATRGSAGITSPWLELQALAVFK